MHNPRKITFPVPQHFPDSAFDCIHETNMFTLSLNRQTVSVSYWDKGDVYSINNEFMPPPAQPAHLTFSFDADNKLTAFETNSLLLLDEFTTKTSEQAILKTYNTLIQRQCRSFISDAATAHSIVYSLPQADLIPAIAPVDQRHYAIAKGPTDQVGYLGTFKADPCVAVGFVAYQDNAFPDIHVMHFDNTCNIKQSVSNSLGQMQTSENHIAAYISSGSKSNLDILVQLVSLFQENSIPFSADLKNSALIMNLSTGQPVHKDNMRHAAILWNENNNNNATTLSDAINLYYKFQRTRPAILEYHLI